MIYKKEMILFNWKIKYKRRTKDEYMGRFGGCWNWHIGIEWTSKTIIIYCLFFMIRMDKLS